MHKSDVLGDRLRVKLSINGSYVLPDIQGVEESENDASGTSKKVPKEDPNMVVAACCALRRILASDAGLHKPFNLKIFQKQDLNMPPRRAVNSQF